MAPRVPEQGILKEQGYLRSKGYSEYSECYKGQEGTRFRIELGRSVPSVREIDHSRAVEELDADSVCVCVRMCVRACMRAFVVWTVAPLPGCACVLAHARVGAGATGGGGWRVCARACVRV